jgi:hypothetical protein
MTHMFENFLICSRRSFIPEITASGNELWESNIYPVNFPMDIIFICTLFRSTVSLTYNLTTEPDSTSFSVLWALAIGSPSRSRDTILLIKPFTILLKINYIHRIQCDSWPRKKLDGIKFLIKQI